MFANGMFVVKELAAILWDAMVERDARLGARLAEWWWVVNHRELLGDSV